MIYRNSFSLNGNTAVINAQQVNDLPRASEHRVIVAGPGKVVISYKVDGLTRPVALPELSAGQQLLKVGAITEFAITATGEVELQIQGIA
jgi:hypothetical protein